jgi:hypothetical protein
VSSTDTFTEGVIDVRATVFVGWVVKASLVAVPGTTVRSRVFVDVVETPFSVPAAWIETVPAALPVTVSVATPPTAADEPSPVTEPDPLALLKVNVSVASGPPVTVFPAASVIVAVTARVVPEARFAVEPDMTIFDAVPNVTGKLTRFEFVAPGPFKIALARRSTGPAMLPVTVIVATPPDALELPSPLTEPLPEGWLNVTLALLSVPDVTVFPAVSSIVAWSVRDVPEASAAIDPVSAIWLAEPKVTVKLTGFEVVAPEPLRVALA